jgi:hypothetical protein
MAPKPSGLDDMKKKSVEAYGKTTVILFSNF